jgi:glycosyltransferase involved in cell wall biosynthesis
MKILHVITAPRAEGTPRLVLDWLEVAGIEQELLFLSEEGELKENFKNTGVWQFYNRAFEPRFKTAPKIAALVKRICLERKPDIAIAWSLGFSHWVALGARLAGVRKNLAHAGNAVGETFMGKYIHTWISFTLGHLLANKIIACSDYVMKSFTSIPMVSSKNIFVVHNCVNVARFIDFDPQQERPGDFVMVATLEPHKDHVTLLKAWKIYHIKHVRSHLFLAGNGSLHDMLRSLAEELEVKNVSFLGTVSKIPELLHRCKIFVFSTTHQEGFGTVLIEALAAGCRIIATDVPACREVLQNGTYGRMVPEKNPEALAAAMEIESSLPMAESEIETRQKYAAQFSPEEMVKKYINIGIEG